MILAHRNSIRLLQLQPALNIIKQRHAGDKNSLNEAQYDLFNKERYSPLLGVLPLLVQLLLVMGMLQVMYHPLQHMLRFDSEVINALIQAVRRLYDTQGTIAEQMLVLDAFQRHENLYTFQSALANFPDSYSILYSLEAKEMHFLGLNLSATPSLANPSFELIIILLSGIAALSFCLVQNKISPGALSQSSRTNKGLTIFTVGLSLYFAFALPVGVGLYWTVGNFTAIGVVLFLNFLYPPKKLAAEALTYLKDTRKTPEQLRDERTHKKELKARERQDASKFSTTKKQLVFYALTSGQYRYYKNIIEHILEHSNLSIHYLTNDPDDVVFTHNNERLIPYYTSQQRTISLMLKLDTDIMVTTVPDLQTFHMKRSIVRDDIEYIFIPHSLASLHVTMKEAACDHFDTVLCVGAHQTTELRRREQLANLPKKKLIKAGYGLYDQLAESYKALPIKDNKLPKILIAPSWQTDNILDSCIDTLLDSLLGQGYEIIVRPHPQYIRYYPGRMKALQEKYSKHEDEVSFVLDFSDNTSVFQSDILITDWSNIAFEFSYCTLKPSIFINTPMKVMNPNYERYGLEVVDITLRDKVGVSVNLDSVESLNEVVTNLLSNKDGYKERIQQALEQHLYYPGRNGEAGGKYLIQRLEHVNNPKE